MEPQKKLIEQVKALLKKRGKKALEIAKQSILQEKIEYESIREALRYFMDEIWFNVPHPALISLTCEAIGGDTESTAHIGAAFVLLAGAADVHDDVIDHSTIKDSKPTVFGKFGEDIALLAGDALLFEGLYILHEACEKLPKNQKQSVLDLTKQAFFEIGSAEAKEVSLRGKLDLPAEEYRDLIKKKVAVAEASAKIGAILGGGTPEEIEELGHYGKTLGTLMTIRDEFLDIFEPDELKNRAENECLPLPILLTFRDSRKKNQIIRLLGGKKITEKKVNRILDITMSAEETQKLKEEMVSLIKKETERLNFVKRCKDALKLLLWSTIDEL